MSRRLEQEIPSVGEDDNAAKERERLLDEREKQKRLWVERLEWLNRKAHALFWVALACAVIYYSNFFRVIWECPYVNRIFFNLGLICVGVNIAITFYLSVYLPYIAKVTQEWDEYCPRVIPTATIVGCSAFVLFLFGLWPVWGWLTILILFSLFMGFLMSAHFLPDGFLGSLSMAIIFFGASFTSHVIPHEGLWH
eukprot:GILI01009901.1.p1 GENE.GILI01009901.1~~GILI01009901.1.p1  ORF type:complete len:208 (+),score=42.28 GILI01009901.1:41-625(+)